MQTISKTIKEKVLKFKSDINVQIHKIEDVVGVHNPHLSPKVNLYALNRV
jgi:hypothetical protein